MKKKSTLRKAREKKKWSVAKLEVESTVSYGAIIKYENGTRRPGIDYAFLLADALGITADELWRPIVKGKSEIERHNERAAYNDEAGQTG